MFVKNQLIKVTMWILNFFSISHRAILLILNLKSQLIVLKRLNYTYYRQLTNLIQLLNIYYCKIVIRVEIKINYTIYICR